MGNIALVIGEKANGTAEIMYWLAPEGRGRGIATKAVQLLRDWAFHSLEIDQIILKTHLDNIASQRVAERAGFIKRQETTLNNLDSDYQWFEYSI